jgi:hypothetical protein
LQRHRKQSTCSELLLSPRADALRNGCGRDTIAEMAIMTEADIVSSMDIQQVAQMRES